VSGEQLVDENLADLVLGGELGELERVFWKCASALPKACRSNPDFMVY